MPEYKAPKTDKLKVEKPVKEKIDRSEVVSAYSEEGQRRAKQSSIFDARFKVLFISLLILMAVAFTMFILWRNGVFGA